MLSSHFLPLGPSVFLILSASRSLLARLPFLGLPCPNFALFIYSSPIPRMLLLLKCSSSNQAKAWLRARPSELESLLFTNSVNGPK